MLENLAFLQLQGDEANIFQQDGVTIHYSRIFRNAVKEGFPGRHRGGEDS
jgi:hypothetical protein